MKRMLTLILTLMLIGIPALAACPAFTLDEFPKIDGSTATLPLSYALMQTSTGVDEATAKLNTHHNKTTESFYSLVNGEADLLLVYEPSQDAYDVAKDAGVELTILPIGLDAPVFLINDQNPISSLTKEQVVGIYSGQYTNWQQLGGEDLPIIAYQRVENSGSQVMVKAQVMKDVAMVDAPRELRPSEMGELIDCIAAYRNTANSIGYSVYFYVNNMYMQDGVKLLQIDGVAPTNETIADGSYPYCQPFYAVIRADEPESSPARQLMNWLTTDEGQTLVESCNYVSVVPAADR